MTPCKPQIRSGCTYEENAVNDELVTTSYAANLLRGDGLTVESVMVSINNHTIRSPEPGADRVMKTFTRYRPTQAVRGAEAPQ